MLRVGLVAGEVSGDVLGAGLIREIKRRYPDAIFEGIGGPLMAAEGMQCWHEADALAVMGLTEVLRHLPRLLRIRRSLVNRWRQSPPDVFVGIDAPDFNLGLELKLRKRGIRTVHYVSPSVWAWREGRVKKIAKACDRVLCLLPFEPSFYRRHQVAASFVGHPLASQIEPVLDTSAHKTSLGLSATQPTLVVMPGSRLGEIARLGRDFAYAAAVVCEAMPNLQVIVPLANEAGATAFRAIIEEVGLTDRVRVSIGNAAACMRAADVLLLASGTATLEGLLHGRPMVVAYRVAPSTYKIVRALGLLKVKVFSLPNLLTPTPLVDEFIQEAVTPDALSAAVMKLFDDPQRIKTMQDAFRDVHLSLSQDSDVRAAAVTLDVAGFD